MGWTAIDVSLCKLIMLLLALICIQCIHSNPIKVSTEVTSKTLIQMPNIQVDKPDSYKCMAVPVTDLEFSNVVGFRIDVIKEVIHHLSVAFCEDYKTHQTLWDCKSNHGNICSGRSIASGGWDGYSKGHNDTMFPEDIGIHLGKDFKMNYVIIEAHFKQAVPDPGALKGNPANVTLFMTKKSQKYSYQKVILYSSGYIPAFSEDFKAEVSYKWESVPVYVYEYFVHTHNYGQLVEGYIVKNNTKILITMENPKERSHDTVHIEGEPIEIRPGDILAVRCSYRNIAPNKVLFGTGGADEMCNLILTFKYDAKEIDSFPEAIKVSTNAQDKVWCSGDGHDQGGVLCGLQQEADSKTSPENINRLIM
ncbi:hypothetical protein CHS0354_016804 [Potamilus streckersoni]|uniref:Peptidylglycine monooxygenase n=1 Tax=Potamilus streckersoni TaxID=2493646 RepID=A0AAE0T424_9BIVA|nr:hypothetical protein CHS0354_016804 [Potamilus streckersoni]